MATRSTSPTRCSSTWPLAGITAAPTPCNPGTGTGSGTGTRGTGGTVYVAIEYAECFSQPISAMPAGCGCESDGCEYSRIRDSFDLSCLTVLPPRDPVPSICDLIARKVAAPCPPCPASPWVALAAVTVPASTTMNLLDTNIDISVRKVLYRTELLQAQLIACCCKPVAPPKPVTVITVNPTNGQSFVSSSPSNVVLTFSKSLVPGSVTTNSVIVMSANTGKPVAGTVVYDDTSHTATFTPAPVRPFLPDNYTVTAKGSGATPLTDTDSLALDGNGDGTGGGDFTSTFSVAKPIG